MNKFVTLLAVAGMIVAGAAHAGKVRDNCGCGIGTMALGDEEGIVSHLAATILNGISGNQTFGVSSGSLGCDQSTTIVSVGEVESFIADNMDHVVTDAANGEGAYLAAIADLLQVELSDREDFYASIQANFDAIFIEADAASVAQSFVNLS